MAKRQSRKAKPKYKLREGLQENPVRIMHNGEWIGVGAPIEMKASPPNIPWTVREATEAEYLEIAERNPYLVQKL